MGNEFFILMKPELGLVFIIFLLLILKVRGSSGNSFIIIITNVLLLLNFAAGFLFNESGELFSGMFVTGKIVAVEKSVLSLGVLIISLVGYDWMKDHKHLAEFYILLLATLLGMFFMISSGHFLMFYLGLELATIPLAALVNFDMEKKKSSEAATKMILLSAFSSGIMLFGISVVYGTTGTLKFAELPALLANGPLQLLSLILVFAGFAFKLSSVPFHFWTADVYEGAPVPVTSFLSVVSKAAIVFVVISVLSPLFKNFGEVFYTIIFLSVVLSITVGNLFAMRQDNIKRFLAFSSIAQVGYILLGLSAENAAGNASVVYFLIIYLFSNLAIFGVVSLVSAKTGKENISDYNGFYQNNKTLGWILAIALFSLAGIPPTAGFFGKLFLLTSGAGKGNFILIGFAAINMVISLYYYLRIVRAIFIEKSERPMPGISYNFSVKIGLIVCMAGIIATGFLGVIYEYVNALFK